MKKVDNGESIDGWTATNKVLALQATLEEQKRDAVYRVGEYIRHHDGMEDLISKLRRLRDDFAPMPDVTDKKVMHQWRTRLSIFNAALRQVIGV